MILIQISFKIQN